MAYLEKLRLANLFRPNPAIDRPFGMPEIDSGNVSAMLRQIVPVARELNRQPEPNLINRNIARRALTIPDLPTNNLIKQKKNVVYGGTEGFSPMQQRFMQQEDSSKQQELRKAELAENFMRQQDLMRQKRDDTEYMFGKEFGAKKELENLGLEQALKMREVDKKAQAERDAFLANQRREDILARERVQGEEARKTLAARPIPTERPLDQSRELSNRMQQLILQHPQVAPYITKNPDTGMMQIGEDASPEQIAWIQKQLTSPQATPETKPGQVMRQRNKKTGAIRESTDGGKTWKEVK